MAEVTKSNLAHDYFSRGDMRRNPRSPALVYFLCILAVTTAFGCRTLLPGPRLPPTEPVLTVEPNEVFPTETVSPDILPIEATEPTVTSQPENSKIKVTREQNLYRITGKTEKELRQQMNVLGPPDEETGKIFDARTDWEIKWYFYYDNSGGQCKIDRTEVSLSLTYTYPEWNPPANASQALVQKWKAYLKKLALHEEGHGSLSEEGAQIIYDTIMAMPPSATCDALGEATNAAAQEKIDELKQQQKDYDEETGHGQTQGAVFP
jgi:predicted secreted Zn-dependent protease